MGYVTSLFETWLEVEVFQKGNFKLTDHGKPKKFWLHWFSKISINCKHNATTVQLQGTKIISSGFNLQILQLTNRLLLACFSKRFINDTIASCVFIEKDLIIPERLSNERKFCITQKLILKMANTISW